MYLSSQHSHQQLAITAQQPAAGTAVSSSQHKKHSQQKKSTYCTIVVVYVAEARATRGAKSIMSWKILS